MKLHKADERLPRDDKPKRDQAKSLPDKDAEKKSKMARLEQWKRLQAEKKAGADKGPKEGHSLDVIMANTNTNAASPSHDDKLKPVPQQSTGAGMSDTKGTDASKRKVHDPDVKSNVQMKLRSFKTLPSEKKSSSKEEKKSSVEEDDFEDLANSKHNPLQDEDVKKNKLVPLDEWHNPHEEKMDEEEMDTTDDTDPLDAFMDGLETTQPPAIASVPQRGEAMFGEDTEPDVQAVGDDLFAFAPKKKKKEVPVVDHNKVTCEYLYALMNVSMLTCSY